MAYYNKDRYTAYLQSKVWKLRSELTKELAGHRCNDCKTPDGPFHTHHETYVNIYHELQEDLVCLCADCHAARHGKNVILLPTPVPAKISEVIEEPTIESEEDIVITNPKPRPSAKDLPYRLMKRTGKLLEFDFNIKDNK